MLPERFGVVDIRQHAYVFFVRVKAAIPWNVVSVHSRKPAQEKCIGFKTSSVGYFHIEWRQFYEYRETKTPFENCFFHEKDTSQAACFAKQFLTYLKKGVETVSLVNVVLM